MNSFVRFHKVLTFMAFSFLALFQQQNEFLNITFSWYHFPIIKDGIFNCSNTFERVLSTCVFGFHYTYTRTFFIRNLYLTLYLITLEIQSAVVFITIQNKRKIKKFSVLRPDLNFLLKRCVYRYVCVFVFFCMYSIKKETDYM